MEERKPRAADFFSLITFSHTVFALPFAFIGYFSALKKEGASFSGITLFLVLLCMVFARSAAMAFNRFADHRIDKLNPRTSGREIPAGIISPGMALLFVFLNAGLFIAAAWFINPVCFALSPVALAVILGYSYTKRFTAFSHLVLGLGLSLAPAGAYLAVSGSIQPAMLWISAVVFTWVSGFDIVYAMQDENFDRKNGLKSIPVWFGSKAGFSIARFFHGLTMIMLLCFGILETMGIFYWAGSALFSGLLIYQHRLVGPGNLNRINLSFFTLNGIGSVVFAMFFLADLYWQ